jgi:hypothetical protein
MGKWNKHYVGLIGCILLFMAFSYWVGQSQTAAYPPYVSFSAHAEGTKALRLLLEEKEAKPVEWRQSWIQLPKRGQDTLLVVEPQDVGKNEQKELLQWVKEGNHLLLFHQQPEGYPDFAVKALDADTADADPAPIHKLRTGAGGEAASFDAEIVTRSRLQPSDKLTVLLQDEQGIVAGRASYGEGTITVFLTPEWLTNGRILQHKHFELIWPYLNNPAHTLWIDEYHHGYRIEPGLLSVYPSWLLLIYAQLLLALLLWLWWKGKRFGPVYTPREWVVRRGDETILAISSWYERQRCNRDALQHQLAFLRQLLLERWGLRVQAPFAELIPAAARKWSPQQVGLLEQLQQRLDEIEQVEAYPTKQFVSDSHLISQIIDVLEKE